MATKQEKIAAFTELMINGTITSDEFTRVIAALDGSVALEPEKEMSPAEKAYAKYITEVVAQGFKSPASVKYPPFDPTMVKEGVVDLDGKQTKLRYIETYVDAQNAYGTMLREPVIIGINDEFEPQFWARHILRPLIGGKSKAWFTTK